MKKNTNKKDHAATWSKGWIDTAPVYEVGLVSLHPYFNKEGRN